MLPVRAVGPLSLGGATAWGECLGLDRLDSQLLLLHALGRPLSDRAWLLAHDTDPVAVTTFEGFKATATRRQGGEPLAYIVGHKEFFGLDLQVDARVLVPRADTEVLVTWSLELLPNQRPRPDGGRSNRDRDSSMPSVLDLGTGSGAIALAIKYSCTDLAVCGSDASREALAVARANAMRLGLDVQWLASSWFDQVIGKKYLVVSNPPYIAEDDHHLAALMHEPRLALTSGTDGLDAIRHIIARAPQYLVDEGWLLLEHAYNQSGRVCELLRARGFSGVQSRTDISGIERCSGGCWTGTR